MICAPVPTLFYAFDGQGWASGTWKQGSKPVLLFARCAAAAMRRVCVDYPVPRGRGLVCVTDRAGEKEEKKKHGLVSQTLLGASGL